jgi:hypothetical protein
MILPESQYYLPGNQNLLQHSGALFVYFLKALTIFDLMVARFLNRIIFFGPFVGMNSSIFTGTIKVNETDVHEKYPENPVFDADMLCVIFFRGNSKHNVWRP